MIFRFPQPGAAAAAAGWRLAAADVAASAAAQCSCRRRRSGMGRIIVVTLVPGVDTRVINNAQTILAFFLFLSRIWLEYFLSNPSFPLPTCQKPSNEYPSTSQ